MTAPEKTCDCKHNVEGECRRFPPVLCNNLEHDPNSLRFPGCYANWHFPPAIDECGERMAVQARPCSVCNGTGKGLPGSKDDWKVCSRCDGRGIETT
jgi:hypothetical protein